MPPKRRASQIATSNLFGRAIPEDVEIVESDDEDVLSSSASEEDSDDESPLIAHSHQPRSSSITYERSSTGFVLSSEDMTRGGQLIDGTLPSTLPFTAEPGLQKEIGVLPSSARYIERPLRACDSKSRYANLLAIHESAFV